MICWRLYDGACSQNPFGGFGASESGGRWNSPGFRAVYCASTLSLAVLEVLVHVEDRSYLRRGVFETVEVDMPDRLIAMPSTLPEDWDRTPHPSSTRQVGDKFLTGLETVALRIPSAVIPMESNFMLNPLHPAFKRVGRKKPIPFRFDEQLAST